MRAGTAIWIASVCVALAAGGALADTAYVRVVDEAGMPISGAVVSAYWFEKPIFTSKVKPGSGNFTCDKRGVAEISLFGKAMVTLRNAGKEGYAFEEYLNLNMRRDFLSGDADTRSIPRRIVLRRLEPASFLLVADSGGFRHSTGTPIQFSIDIFHKMRKEWRTLPYDDFFVSSRYHEDQRRWETVFWTTNANCGLVATVNRRFTAPETGYVSRIEVSQEDFTNKAFTLYLKTRDPSVYVMIPFGLSDLQSRGPVGQVGPIWDFRYKDARINPYGGREMERDGRTDGFNSDLRDEALHALLVERRYPPKPDIEARMANFRKQVELNDEIVKAREVNASLREKIRETEERMKEKPKDEVERATMTYRSELTASGDIVRRCSKEISRLKKESHTLNLPEEKRGDME